MKSELLSLLFFMLLSLSLGAFADEGSLASMCSKVSLKSCNVPAVANLVQGLTDQCLREVAACKQDGYQPQRKCDEVAVCTPPPTISEYAQACAKNWKGAWGEIVTDLWKTPVSPEALQRQEHFKNCISMECKKNTLSSAAGFFSKLELEGHPSELASLNLPASTCDLEASELLKKIPAEKVSYYCGESAYNLYRRLPQRLGDQDKYQEPWPGGRTRTGAEMRSSVSLQEMLDTILKKQLGMLHEECFDPLTLMELRCYAAFTVLDPLMAAGLASKALKIAKLFAKTSKELAALNKVDEVRGLAKVAEIPVCSPVPCPQWLDHLNLDQAIRHIKPHLSNPEIQSDALRAIEKKVQQQVAEDPLHPPNKGDIEKMLKGYNTREKQVFRSTPNTFFPQGMDVQELVEQIKHGKIPLEVRESPVDNAVHYVATLNTDGKKTMINIRVCSQPDCKLNEKVNGVVQERMAHQGDILTVFPECGPGVKTVLGSDILAKSLRDNPSAPLSSLIVDNPCP